MTAQPGSDYKMRDFEIALMDLISTVFEILVARNIVRAEVAAEMLRRQRDAYPAEQMPGAVFLMDYLIDRLTDPARAAAGNWSGIFRRARPDNQDRGINGAMAGSKAHGREHRL